MLPGLGSFMMAVEKQVTPPHGASSSAEWQTLGILFNKDGSSILGEMIPWQER